MTTEQEWSFLASTLRIPLLKLSDNNWKRMKLGLLTQPSNLPGTNLLPEFPFANIWQCDDNRTAILFMSDVWRQEDWHEVFWFWKIRKVRFLQYLLSCRKVWGEITIFLNISLIFPNIFFFIPFSCRKVWGEITRWCAAGLTLSARMVSYFV